jgi:hypothetical protein
LWGWQLGELTRNLEVIASLECDSCNGNKLWRTESVYNGNQVGRLSARKSLSMKPTFTQPNSLKHRSASSTTMFSSIILRSLLPLGILLLAVNGALTPVTDFGSNPTGLTMSIYVPAKLATNPAVILAVRTLNHSRLFHS